MVAPKPMIQTVALQMRVSRDDDQPFHTMQVQCPCGCGHWMTIAAIHEHPYESDDLFRADIHKAIADHFGRLMAKQANADVAFTSVHPLDGEPS